MSERTRDLLRKSKRRDWLLTAALVVGVLLLLLGGLAYLWCDVAWAVYSAAAARRGELPWAAVALVILLQAGLWWVLLRPLWRD